MKSFDSLHLSIAFLFSHFSHSAPTSESFDSLLANATNETIETAVHDSPNYVGYVGDPNGRGTASLVISCLLTLVLCVWSALHLNVPHRRQSWVGSLFVNCRWIITGVYAPELVVFTAWRQWSSARLLGKLVQMLRENQAQEDSSVESAQILPQRSSGDTTTSSSHFDNSKALANVSSPSPPPMTEAATSQDEIAMRIISENSSLKQPHVEERSQLDAQPDQPRVEERMSVASCEPWTTSKHFGLQKEDTYQGHFEWTMTHDFFASTGGFAFEIETEATPINEKGRVRPFLPPNAPHRLTLTARGVALLARCGHLPSIPEAEISDKSKANDLAKALVIIQATWMLIQVIGRLIARLPVTLLEVNTIAHVWVDRLRAFHVFG